MTTGRRTVLKNRQKTQKTRVLAVDDNPASLRLIELMLEKGEYQVICAADGFEAVQALEEHGESIDIILLDRMMPGMDGIEFCRRIKQEERWKLIPIIMQTAAGRPQEIREGIEAGVFYYLVKPLVSDTLLSIVASACKKVRNYRKRREQLLQRQESIAMVDYMKCSFRTIEEGETLSTFLAQFFPQPDEVITGMSELFLNAVEHGNLEISYEEKSRLIKENIWDNEVKRRLEDSSLGKRVVTVVFEKKGGSCSLQVHDEGNGFNWEKYLQVDPSRATHNHGRGIAMANMLSFDQLIYNVRGNQVTGLVERSRGNGQEEERENGF